jgi:hypothetical protein
MDKILEALKKILPDNEIKEVASAVEEFLNEANKELEAQKDALLEEAYADLHKELKNAEKIGEEGYTEAYGIIKELTNRLEIQREELEAERDSGFEEAYQMILAERAQKNSVEVDIYDEYDQKLNEMKEYMIDMLDLFLQQKGSEIYEQAKRDTLTDPRLAEDRVALDKIVEIAAGYLSNEDYTFATSNKLDHAVKANEELQAQIKMMEARNIRLSKENTKLNENFRQYQEQLITENKNEKKERVQKAKQVSGRGDRIVQEETVVTEQRTPKGETKEEATDLLKNLGLDRDTANVLAGTKIQK